MKRAEKAQRIQAILEGLYPAPPVPLVHRDPFTLLIAVLLSAQCTDERVNRVTPGLFAVASTPDRMAKVETAKIQSLIRTCGLAPGKARNISALSKIILDEHGGRVPEDFASLEALPGVGHKTASVVVAQAFGRPAFPVDTHIHRLAGRWGLSQAHTVEQTEGNLKVLFPESSWSWLHLALIYFGREHCPARGHDLTTCPICSWAATARRIAEEARAGGGGPGSRKAVARKKAAVRKKAARKKTARRKVR